jgi:hypothetical protein
LKENEEKFTGDYFKNHTDKAIKYFDRLKKVKHFNFIGWTFYADLYQHESLLYRLENFCILNLPTIGRIIFKMRKKIQKRREAKKNMMTSGAGTRRWIRCTGQRSSRRLTPLLDLVTVSQVRRSSTAAGEISVKENGKSLTGSWLSCSV